jgi:hypothetical protein
MLQIWSDGALCDEEEEEAYAALMWHSSDPPRFASTRAIDRCTSSTFEETVALIHAFQLIPEHTVGCSLHVFSDNLSALQYIVNNY